MQAEADGDSEAVGLCCREAGDSVVTPMAGLPVLVAMAAYVRAAADRDLSAPAGTGMQGSVRKHLQRVRRPLCHAFAEKLPLVPSLPRAMYSDGVSLY